MKAASVYARLGWSVVPLHSAIAGVCSCARGAECPNAGKHPRIKEWELEASADAAVIAGWVTRWPTGNVGIATGSISGFFALDVDPKNDGPATLAALIAVHGPLPETVEARTGSGGSHYLFRMPEFAVGNRAAFRDANGVKLVGLDVRGDGGQIVVAPSVSAKGVYTWVRPPWKTKIAPAPAWLLEALRRPARVAAPTPSAPEVRPSFPPASPEVLEAARDALAEHGPAIEGQGGDEHTFIAGALLAHDFALTEEEAWPLLVEWNETCQPPWSLDDLAAKLRGGAKYATREFGCRRTLDLVDAVRKVLEGWRSAGTGEAGMHDVLQRVRELAALCEDPALHAVIANEVKTATGVAISKLGLPPPGTAKARAARLARTAEFNAGGAEIVDPEDPLTTSRQFLRSTADDEGLPEYLRHGAAWWRALGTRWSEVSDEQIRRTVYGFLDGKRDLRDGAPIRPDRYLVETTQHALTAAAARVELEGRSPPAWIGDGAFPADEIIACTNGLLHTRTRAFIPSTRRFFGLNAVEFPYDPHAPAAVEWTGFVGQICGGDRESIETIQEWAGLCLTTDTSFQKALAIIGPPRSGKGTYARILTRLVGAENVTAPTLNGLGQHFGLQSLIGKQLAVISDARLGGRADQGAVVENLLRTIGEDTLSVPRKHREDWVGRLTARFLLLSNELPAFLDASGALPSRFILVRLTESFLGREDRGLEGRLLSELPGILLWALDGLDRLRKRGYLRQPASAGEFVRQLAELASPIKAFAEERCVVAPGASVDVAALFEAWRAWSFEHGREHPGSKQIFGRNLTAAFPHVRTVQARVNGGRERRYEGIGLASRDGTRAEPLRVLSEEESQEDAA
ncbi:MAG: phage/plasmid primase, P4 family [Myxococcota bacterium]